MSLMKSRQPKQRWGPGDYIGAMEAARILGWKSSKNLRDPKRLRKVIAEFESYDCTLTVGLKLGGQKRFLRHELQDFIDAQIAAAQAAQAIQVIRKKRNPDLRIAA